jgi:hypothetical protein
MTITAWAALHGKSTDYARKLIYAGRVPEAKAVQSRGISQRWDIPEGTPWPEPGKVGAKPGSKRKEPGE